MAQQIAFGTELTVTQEYLDWYTKMAGNNAYNRFEVGDTLVVLANKEWVREGWIQVAIKDEFVAGGSFGAATVPVEVAQQMIQA